MREVRTCDFCGADGRGVYEVLPPEIDGGRRMVLCPPCKDTLADVVAPLLDRLNEDAEVAHTRAAERVRADADARSTERRRERAATREAPATGDGDHEMETEAAAVDTPAESVEADETEPEDGEAETEDENEEPSPASETIAREAAVPPAYRKVVRFLRNREFPMDRTEAEALAAGAYDLDDEVVHRIVEHAIAEGRFSSDGDTLTR
ncbi:hypothetical protein [Natronomonas sp. EA1]|uniref:hypothetical protein n=1 Tax=Natronomonas sp. EA1 TaxID=3421655 RepID=UPI003EBE3519